MFPRVSVIILNWNGWRDTIECLESLYRITYPNYDVIVVDNGSKDDSIQKIKEYAGGKIRVDSKFFEYNPANKPIKVFKISEDKAKQGKFNRPLYEKFDPDRRMILIRNKDNYGFAGGNNIGIKFALSVLNTDYVLLLNNDTVVDTKFLSELIRVAETDDWVGIVGPKIYYYDYNGRSDIIWSAGGKLNLWRIWIDSHIGLNKSAHEKYDISKKVDWISGAALMMKTCALQTYPLLDPKYFFGFEDVELCTRVRKNGSSIFYVPTARVWHKVGISRQKSAFKYRDFVNYFDFIRRNFSMLIYFYQIMLFTALKMPQYIVAYTFKNKTQRNTFIRNLKKLYMGE